MTIVRKAQAGTIQSSDLMVFVEPAAELVIEIESTVRAQFEHLIRGKIEEVLASHPDEPLALAERGQLALDEGEAERAERWLSRAAVRLPGNRQVQHGLALCARQLGRPEDAHRHQERAEQIDADAKRLTDLRREILKLDRAPQQRCEAGVICHERDVRIT